MLFLRVKRQKPAASALIYCLIAVFAVSGLVPPSAQAQELSARLETPAQTIMSSFQVPEELGTIREVFSPESQPGRFIVYLQVAHNHYDAEFHTQELIRLFHEKYGISLVFLEGGEGPLDRLYFRSFPDQEIKSKISEDYLKRGDLTGGETAAILLDDPNLKFYGVEEKALYAKDKELFLTALEREKEIGALLRPLEETLFEWMQSRDTAGRQVYDLRRAFRSDQMDLLHYLIQLKSRYLETALGKDFQNTYPEIAKLLDAQEHQKIYDQAEFQAAMERFLRHFETRMLPGLAREERMRANSILQDYRTEKIDGGSALYQLLPIAQAQQAGFQLDPVLRSGAHHAGNLASIRGTGIFQELKSLEAEICEAWVSDPDEKDILKLDEKIYFLKDLSRLEVLPEELETLRGNQPSSLLPQNVLAKLQVSRDLRRTLDPLFEAHLEFYELAYQRDEAIFRNVMRRMEENGKNSAILVTGGFHTGGIARHLKESKAAYAVITPKMTAAGEREIYLNTMRGKRSFMRYFNGSLWDALARDYAARIAGAVSGRVLKEWRDRIIQNAMTEGRITEANFYTQYIDALDAKGAGESSPPISNNREIQIKQAWDFFFGNYSETIKREKLRQFDVFADGFRALWAEGNVNPSSVGALFGRLQSVGNSQIAAELALTNDRQRIREGRFPAEVFPFRRSELRPVSEALSKLGVRPGEFSAIVFPFTGYHDITRQGGDDFSFVEALGRTFPQVRDIYLIDKNYAHDNLDLQKRTIARIQEGLGRPVNIHLMAQRFEDFNFERPLTGKVVYVDKFPGDYEGFYRKNWRSWKRLLTEFTEAGDVVISRPPVGQDFPVKGMEHGSFPGYEYFSNFGIWVRKDSDKELLGRQTAVTQAEYLERTIRSSLEKFSFDAVLKFYYARGLPFLSGLVQKWYKEEAGIPQVVYDWLNARRAHDPIASLQERRPGERKMEFIFPDDGSSLIVHEEKKNGTAVTLSEIRAASRPEVPVRSEMRTALEESALEIISRGAEAYQDVSGGIVELISFVRGENGPEVGQTFQAMLKGKAPVEDVRKMFGSKAALRYQSALEQQKPEILNSAVKNLTELFSDSDELAQKKHINWLAGEFQRHYLKEPSLGALFVIGNALIDIGPESVIPLSDLLGSTSPKDYGLFDGIVQSLIAIGDRHPDFRNVITGLLEDRFQDLGPAVTRIRGRLDRALERWQTSSVSRSELRPTQWYQKERLGDSPERIENLTPPADPLSARMRSELHSAQWRNTLMPQPKEGVRVELRGGWNEAGLKDWILQHLEGFNDEQKAAFQTLAANIDFVRDVVEILNSQESKSKKKKGLESLFSNKGIEKIGKFLDQLIQFEPESASSKIDAAAGYQQLIGFFAGVKQRFETLRDNYPQLRLAQLVSRSHTIPEWKGEYHLKLIASQHGALSAAERILAVSQSMLMHPNEWLIFYEGIGREELGEIAKRTGATPDLQLVQKLAELSRIPLVDSIPEPSDPEVMRLVAQELNLSEDEAMAASSFRFLYPQLKQNPNSQLALQLLLAARKNQAQVIAQIIARKFEQLRRASEADKSNFVRLITLVEGVEIKYRNQVAQDRLIERLRSAGKKRLLAIVGNQHTPVFDVPVQAMSSYRSFEMRDLRFMMDRLSTVSFRAELRLEDRLDQAVRELDENAYPGKAKFLQRVSEKLFGRVTYQSIWERIKGRNAEIQGLLARDQYSSDDYDRLKEAIAKELKGEEAAIGPIHIGSFIGAMFSLAGILNFKGLLISAIVHFSVRTVLSAVIAAGLISFLLFVTAVLIQKGLSDYLRLEILQNALGNAIAEDSVSPSRFVPALGVGRNLWERVLETLLGWRIALNAKFRRSQTPPAPSILKPSPGEKRSELRGQTEILVSSEASNWNELVRKINSAINVLSEKGFSRIDELELPGGAASSLIRGWQFVNGSDGRVLSGKLRQRFGASDIFFSRSRHRRGQKISVTVQKVTVPDPEAGEGGSVQKIRLVFAHVPVQIPQGAAAIPQRSELRDSSTVLGFGGRMREVDFGRVAIWKPEDKKINIAVYRPYDSDPVKTEKIDNEISAFRAHWKKIPETEPTPANEKTYSPDLLHTVYEETIQKIRGHGSKSEEVLRQIVKRYTSDSDFQENFTAEEKMAISLIQNKVIPSLEARDQLVYTETGSGGAAGQEAVDFVEMAQERLGVKLFERFLNLPYGLNTDNEYLIREERQLAKMRRGFLLNDPLASQVLEKIADSPKGTPPKKAVDLVIGALITPKLQQFRTARAEAGSEEMRVGLTKNIETWEQVERLLLGTKKEMDVYDFIHELNATAEEIADLKAKEAERHSAVMGKMAEIFPEMSERLSGILFGPDSGSFEHFVQNEISKGRPLSYAAAKFYYRRYIKLKKESKLISVIPNGSEKLGNTGDIEPELLDFLMRYYDYAEFGIPTEGEKENFVVIALRIEDEIAFNRLQSQFRRHGHIVAIISPTGTPITHWVIFSEKDGIIAVPGADFKAAGIAIEDIPAGSVALVDGREGKIILNPDAETLEKWMKVGKNYRNLNEYYLRNATLPVLFNGEEVEIGADEANIEAMEVPEGVEEDTSLLYRFGAALVGLFRLEEFFFHMKNAYQGIEIDSVQLKLAILRALSSPFFAKTTRPLVMRVFDPQPDKLPPEAWWGQNDDGSRRTEKEIRQIVKKYPDTRFYLNAEYPEFRQYLKMQLEAAFMAAERETNPSLRILFPNVQTEEDVQWINDVIAEVKSEYLAKFPSASTAQHAAKINAVPIGFMYEKQGAILSPKAKFIGIGSNDLLQDILGVSRDDETAGREISLLNPQLVREIWRVGAFGKANKIEVTLEGEWGGSRRMLLVLLMMRLKGVKVVPVAKRTLIPELKEFVRHVTPEDLSDLGDLFEATVTSGIALPDMNDLDTAVAKKVKDIESRIIGSEGFQAFLAEKEREELKRELRGERSELRADITEPIKQAVQHYQTAIGQWGLPSTAALPDKPAALQGQNAEKAVSDYAKLWGELSKAFSDTGIEQIVYPFIGPDILPGFFNPNVVGINDDPQDLLRGKRLVETFLPGQSLSANSIQTMPAQNALDLSTYEFLHVPDRPPVVFLLKGFYRYGKQAMPPKKLEELMRLLFGNFLNQGDVVLILNRQDLATESWLEAADFSRVHTSGRLFADENTFLEFDDGNRPRILLLPDVVSVWQKRSELRQDDRGEPSREEVEALVTALEQDPRHAEKLFEEFEALLKKSEGMDSPDDMMRFLLTIERAYETAWEAGKDDAVESLKDLIHLIHEKYLSSLGTQAEREWDFSTRVVEAKIHLLFSRFGSLDGLANKQGALLESPVSDGEGWLDGLLRALELNEPGEEEMPERSELRMDPITGFPQPYSLPPAAKEAKVDGAAEGSPTPGEGDAADRERRPADQGTTGQKKEKKPAEPVIQRSEDTFEPTTQTPPVKADGRDMFIPSQPPIRTETYQPPKQKRSELRLNVIQAGEAFLNQDASGFVSAVNKFDDPEVILEIRQAVTEALELSFEIIRGKEAQILTELIGLRNIETSDLMELLDRNGIPVSPEFGDAVSELTSRLNQLNADSPEALAAELERRAFVLIEAMKQNIPDGTSAVFEMPSGIAQLENRDEQLDQFMKAAVQTLMILNVRLRIVAEGSLVTELSRWLGRNSSRETQSVNGRIQIIEARSRGLYADNTEAVQATEDLGMANQVRRDLVLLGIDRYGETGTNFDYQDSKLASKLLTAMFAALLKDQITDNLFVIEGNTRRIKNPEAFQVLVYALHTLAAQARALARSA